MPFITFCAKVRPQVDASHGARKCAEGLWQLWRSMHLSIYVQIMYIYIYIVDIYIYPSIHLSVCLSTDPSVGCFYDGLNKLSDHSFVNNNFFAEFFCIAKGDTKKTGTPSNSCTGPIWFLRNLGIPYKVSSRICIYIYVCMKWFI